MACCLMHWRSYKKPVPEQGISPMVNELNLWRDIVILNLFVSQLISEIPPAVQIAAMDMGWLKSLLKIGIIYREELLSAFW